MNTDTLDWRSHASETDADADDQELAVERSSDTAVVAVSGDVEPVAVNSLYTTVKAKINAM